MGIPKLHSPVFLLRLRLSNSVVCDNLSTLPTPSQWKEVKRVNEFITFILSVMAGIVAYYVCKWWDER